MNRHVAGLTLALALLAASGCANRERRRDRGGDPPPPPPSAKAAPASEARCEHADKAHKWAYYPDEPLYFCDRHQHHWVQEGGSWRHVEQYDARPNYAAHMLSNQSEFEIHTRNAEHARAYPPGSRRR